MCGLVGIVGANLGTLHLEAFKWLLHFDVTRGEDSTGVAFKKTATLNPNQSKLVVAKAEGHPLALAIKFPELFSKKGVLHYQPLERFDFLMGHNRAATIGAVSANNAHPFHHGPITGCHNGTIASGLTSLPNSSTIVGNTDSERLIYALSKGLTIKEIMDKVKGAAAMSWWDSSKKTFNLYRNKERSLFFTHDDAKTIFAYASEEWILRMSLNKAKLLELTKNIKEFPVNSLLEIKLGNNSVEEVTTTIVEPPKPVVAVYPVANPGVKLLDHTTPHWFRGVFDETPSFRTPSGWLSFLDLTKEEFDKKAKTGCSYCQTDLEYEDNQEGFVKWLDAITPFCSCCAKEFTKENIQ
jgi:asparagine synthetase B (glutamine-hydrolysing)